MMSRLKPFDNKLHEIDKEVTASMSNNGLTY